MKQHASALAGLGGVAFAVLLAIAFLASSPTGGTYSASDVANFVAKGHRVVVVVSVYLVLLAVAGLLALIARLRALSGDSTGLIWASGVVGGTSIALGFLLMSSISLARMYGSSAAAIDPRVAYTLAEAGWVLLLGAGGVFLSLSLLGFAISVGDRVPGWVRWFTVVAAVVGLASAAWFPFFILLLWSLVIGGWLIAADRSPALRTAHA